MLSHRTIDASNHSRVDLKIADDDAESVGDGSMDGGGSGTSTPRANSSTPRVPPASSSPAPPTPAPPTRITVTPPTGEKVDKRPSAPEAVMPLPYVHSGSHQRPTNTIAQATSAIFQRSSMATRGFPCGPRYPELPRQVFVLQASHVLASQGQTVHYICIATE